MTLHVPDSAASFPRAESVIVHAKSSQNASRPTWQHLLIVDNELFDVIAVKLVWAVFFMQVNGNMWR